MDIRQGLQKGAFLPADHRRAQLIGRVQQPGVGPVLVKIQEDGVYDLTPIAATSSQLIELPNVARVITGAGLQRLAPLDDVLENTAFDRRCPELPWFLSPCDLQAVKASGVTFVSSMLERVIEEQARGDPAKAGSVRRSIVAVIGEDLSRVVPGSSEALRLKEMLIDQGMWSQYLEVGIGVDAEIFTKCQPMSSIGTGDEVGVHPKSTWNNPEPEVVLVVNSRGETVGAALGNDVNLRDFEGRSALLLGKAKDNNASCAIGPFFRLFDDHFTIDDVRQCELTLRIEGPEGFTLTDTSPMSLISRDPLDLVSHTINATHQYPDGLVIFLGTMFAPTKDRLAPGQGFTHRPGDIVTITSPKLGTLANRVTTSDRAAPWLFGVSALMRNLADRNVL